MSRLDSRCVLAARVVAGAARGCELRRLQAAAARRHRRRATTRSPCTSMFRDVLDLVPAVDGQGQRRHRRQGHRRQRSTATPPTSRCELRNDVELPDNAIAEIRQTSLLGEKFVSLSAAGEDASTGQLGDGDVIPLDRTGRNPEVEEVLGALSLLLNGGGVAQLKTIAQELNKALDGPRGLRPLGADPDRARSCGQLDDNKADIVHAIELAQPARALGAQQEGTHRRRARASCPAR